LERQDNRYCLKCGYDLRGQVENRCPECGGEFKPDDSTTFAESPPCWVRLRAAVSPLCNRYMCAALVLVLATIIYLVALSHTLAERLPLPLRSPLSRLDTSRLSPYSSCKEVALSPEVVSVLGANECIQWNMQEAGGRGRTLSLLVTYYTGSLEGLRIPHYLPAPDGPRLVTQKDLSITVTSCGKPVAVPIRVDEYVMGGSGGSSSGKRWVVARTHHANGGFSGDRAGVRQIVNSSTDRYFYVSRVEVTTELDSQTTRDDAVESVKRFFQVAIPVLLEDHWPSWESRPLSPPAWFPWLPARARPSPVTRPSA
jgi:hypothetical protein